MGKGKGGFHHWAARVPIGRVVFEIGGGGIAGKWEIITRGTPARIGLHQTYQEMPSEKADA